MIGAGGLAGESRDDRAAAFYGRGALERIRSSTVVFFGGGLIGGVTFHQMTGAGARGIVVDCDTVAPANLGTQGFAQEQLGQPKASARVAQALALDPKARVVAIDERLEDCGIGVFAGADLFVGGLDGRAARLRVATLSSLLGIPWIDAAVDGSGEHLLGTVSCYDPRSADGACYGCRYDAQALAEIAREGRGPGCPSWRDDTRPLTPPTLTATGFGNAVAGLQAVAGLRVLANGGDTTGLAGRRLELWADDVMQTRTRSFVVARSPHCAYPHAPLAPLRASGALSIGVLVAEATRDLGARPAGLRLHDRVLVDGLACRSCGAVRKVLRVRERFDHAEVRCPNGCEPDLEPQRETDRLEGSGLETWSDATWAALGLPEAEVVTAFAASATGVNSGTNEAHYIVGRAAGQEALR